MFKTDGEEINSHLQHSKEYSQVIYIEIKRCFIFPCSFPNFLSMNDSFLIKLLLTFLTKNICFPTVHQSHNKERLTCKIIRKFMNNDIRFC